MRQLCLRIAAATLAFLLALPAQSTAASIDALRQRCEAAREKRIAPLRKEAVAQCIAEKQHSPEDCARMHNDFGAGGATAAGGYRPRMFHDLPECLELYEAEQKETQAR